MTQATIRTALYTWLTRSLGVRHVVTLTFSADLITGNSVGMTVNGTPIDAVAFTTDHDTTLEALAVELVASTVILQATVTGAREITITALNPGVTLAFTAILVSGGASQATGVAATETEQQSCTVIFADQNSPRPDYPYAVIRIGSMIKIGFDELRDWGEDTHYIGTFGGQRRATVTVDYFGSDPVEEITKAHNALEKQSIKELFIAAEIATLDRFGITNLTAMLETLFEPRASFDFYIGFADNYEDDIGVIEHVELTSTYETEQGELIIGPETIEV